VAISSPSGEEFADRPYGLEVARLNVAVADLDSQFTFQRGDHLQQRQRVDDPLDDQRQVVSSVFGATS
jgi:hypothetical protein